MVRMLDHPISGLIDSSLKSIKEMMDVDTIVGDPITTPDGTTIIPISKVSVGFGAGGSDVPTAKTTAEKDAIFGGASGAGMSISPVAFLVVKNDQVKLVPISSGSSAADKIVDYIPYVMDKLGGLFKKKDKEEKSEL